MTVTDTTDEKPETNGREADGRFAAGNRIGRGRPRREVEAAFLQAFCDGCSADTLQQIVAVLAAKALGGNIAAIRLVLQHAMPAQQLRVELASTDEEYRVAGASPAEGMDKMMRRIQQKVEERREYEACLRDLGVEIGVNSESTDTISKGQSVKPRTPKHNST